MLKFIILLTGLVLRANSQSFSFSDLTFLGSVVPAISLSVPTFVRSGTNSANTGASLTVSAFNCSGGNYLIVGISEKSGTTRTVSSVTCNTVTCTQLAVSNLIAASGRVYIYGLANPTTGDVVVTLTGSVTAGVAMGTLLFNGVGSNGATDAINQTVLAASSSVAPTSVTTDLVVDILAFQDIANNFTAGGSQTVKCSGILTIGNAALLMSTKTGTSSTTTMSWSVDGVGAIMSQLGVSLHGQ